jgi:hypothetical protein
MYKYYILIALILLLAYSFYVNAKDDKYTFRINTYDYSVRGRHNPYHMKRHSTEYAHEKHNKKAHKEVHEPGTHDYYSNYSVEGYNF